MPLFDNTPFVGASGRQLNWKIECDVLSWEDWECLASMAVTMMPPFSVVRGVPSGGIPFADALRSFCTPDTGVGLVADDVWTTGGSVARFQREWADSMIGEPLELLTVVAFNRSGESLPPGAYSVLSVNRMVMP